MQTLLLEREGQTLLSDKRFISKKKLEDVIQQIVAETNRIVNEATPIVDTRLSDGSRVNVSFISGCIKRTDCHYPKISKRKYYIGKITAMGSGKSGNHFIFTNLSLII